MLVGARYREVPYLDHTRLLGELESWVDQSAAFAACVIGGGGGSGKTRLAVELCERPRDERWVGGLLVERTDRGALDALARAPKARLVVIDYAETRVEQLDALLPLLAQAATSEWPVRIVLIVRAVPRDSVAGWRDVLRPRGGDPLRGLLNDTAVWALDDLPLRWNERVELFEAATDAFSRRVGGAPPMPVAMEALEEPLYAKPLMVVVAAYLAGRGQASLPTSRCELFEELLNHEDHYWDRSAGGRVSDPTLRRRVAAIATLAGATSEREASERCV